MRQMPIGPTILLAGLCVTAGATAVAEEGLYSSAEEVRPLLVGMSIPDGALAGPKGEVVPVGVEHVDGPTIFVFYRGYW